MGEDTLKWAAPTAAVIVIALIGAGWRMTRWSRDVDNDLARISAILDTIKTDLGSLRSDFDRFLRRFPEAAIVSESPARLSEFGDRLSSHMDAVTWAEGVAFEHAPTVQDREPYEVDDFAAVFVAEHLSDEMRARVRRCAYEFGLDRAEPEAVLRVVLRDALLAAMASA